MLINKLKPYYLLFLIFIGFACSPESAGIVSYTYHNITARFNAYFIANEKLKEVKSEIKQSHEFNFDKVLPVFVPIDTNVVNANEEKIQDVIKKASIGIQRHKVSKWVDDCYILVGRARMLMQEYEESVETFKYVNVNGEDEQTKYEALSYLIRTFTEYEEYNNAIAVINFLQRKKLNKKNKVRLYLNAAYLYQKTNDFNNVIVFLNKAAPLMSRGIERARIYFILAQLYQKAGFDAMAYENYQAVLQNKPTYSFFFHSRLNMARVTEINENSDIKEIRKYFSKLLKDGKNTEYKDKIYYELAEFEYKQDNLKKAVQAYKASVRTSVENRRQKGFSYYKLGKLYFDDLKNYELANAYYDSAVQFVPSTESVFPKIESTASVLSDFVKQINTINRNDSLLNLAKLDSASLNQLFDQKRAERIAKEEALEKKRRREERNTRSNRRNISGFNDQMPTSTVKAPAGTFYFYDPNTVARGNNEFEQIWGSRALADNWRTKPEQKRIETPTGENELADNATGQSENIPDEKNNYKKELQAFYAKIPFEKERKEQLKSEVEKALYRLGNIYNFDLEEKEEAISTYKTLVDRFPNSEYRPEILYLLYIYYKERDIEQSRPYAKELTEKYPETTFAKLVENPNYREESNKATAQVKKLYEKAYLAYDSANYIQALKVVNDGLNNYSENDYEDNMKLLKAMIVGATEGKDNYRYQLQEFIKNYTESEMIPYAKELLNSIEALEKKKKLYEQIKYVPYFDQAHYFVVLYEKNKALGNILPVEIENFALEYFPELSLNAGTLVYNDELTLILLSEFNDRKSAEDFYEKFSGKLSPLQNFKSIDFNTFIISKDNFQIFYKSKLPNSYDQFFKDNYEFTP